MDTTLTVFVVAIILLKSCFSIIELYFSSRFFMECFLADAIIQGLVFLIGLFECSILLKNLVAIKRIGRLIETDDFRLMNWQLAVAVMYLLFLAVVIGEAIYHAHLYNKALSDSKIDPAFVLKEILISYMC